MLKEKDYIFSRMNMALDFSLCVGAVLISHFLRNYILGPYIIPTIFRYRSHLSDYWWLLLFLPVITVALLQYYGYYKSQRVRSVWSVLFVILIASVGAGLSAIAMSFIFTPRGNGAAGLMGIFSEEFVSRGVLLLYLPTATFLLSAKTMIVRYFLLDLRLKGFNTRNLLLVGSLDLAVEFLGYVNNHPYWGFQVAGIITDKAGPEKEAEGIPVAGEYKDLFNYLEHNIIDDVVFVARNEGLQALAPMLQGCEEMGIRTRLPMHMTGNKIARPMLEYFDGLPVITFNPVREFGAALMFKYMFDRVAATILLAVLSPVFLVVALLIKLTSENKSDPIFYGQTRCGLGGRQFTLWKFRSMQVDADNRRDELEKLNEMTGPVFKIRNDPRVTKVGRWLRKTSLDELPQLWNVFLGQMSLVGPRPPLPREVAEYDRWQRRRLSMKPGITCIWQVSGRNKLTFQQWMQLDLQYIDNWSLFLDFRILCKTLYVVVSGYGAM